MCVSAPSCLEPVLELTPTFSRRNIFFKLAIDSHNIYGGSDELAAKAAGTHTTLCLSNGSTEHCAVQATS